MGTEMCWQEFQGVNARGKHCSTWGDDPTCNAPRATMHQTQDPCLHHGREHPQEQDPLPFSVIRTFGSGTSQGEPQAVTANSSGTNGKQKSWVFFKDEIRFRKFLTLRPDMPLNPDKEGLQSGSGLCEVVSLQTSCALLGWWPAPGHRSG